ncbi:MAG: ATP-binding protein [Campylobacterota bacterium]|nr:ATP-binding protein [Campylobacterota bacterium]
MKTTLVKKLLLFIIPLFTIPILAILLFFYTYLIHISHTDSANLAMSSLNQTTNNLDNYIYNQDKVLNYLIRKNKDSQCPITTIVDKDLNILVNSRNSNIYKKYIKNSQKIKQYIKNSIDTNSLDIKNDKVLHILIKPLVNNQNKIVAFIINDYKHIFDKRIVTIDQTFIYILFIIIFIIFISTIFTIIFSFQLTYPISLLVDTIKKISKGDLFKKIDIVTNDETSILVNSFNKMIKKQKSLHDQVIHLNENLESRIKEEVKKNRQKDKLIFEQSKLASMGEMIGNIAHQWRQPLTVISSGATGLKLQKEHDVLTDEEFYDTCDAIDNNSQYLSKTIDDFKNFIKGDRKKRIFNLKTDIDSFLHLIEGSIKNNHINIILDLQETIQIEGYENELIQCLINLFNNSKDALKDVKYDEKLLFITTFIRNNSVYIIIKDNGGGIEKKVLTKIFEPYFTTKHQSKGTGLGLHMTHNFIVDSMGGTIDAHNTKYNYQGKGYIGAEFVIKLPMVL